MLAAPIPVKLMSLLDLPTLSTAAAPEELLTLSLWRNWTGRIDAQTLARPVVELAEKAQIDLPPGDWGPLAHYAPEFPFSTMPKEKRRSLILLVATLAEDSAACTTHQLVDAPYMVRLTSYGNPMELVSEATWNAWCQALKAGESKGKLVGEIAGELRLPWPSSRRSEGIESYLDLTLAEIRAISNIGRKRLRTIVLCIAQGRSRTGAHKCSGRTSSVAPIDPSAYRGVPEPTQRKQPRGNRTSVRTARRKASDIGRYR